MKKIYRLRSQLYLNGEKILNEESISPVLVICETEDRIFGYPISFKWILAGKGVPFYDEDETAIGLPFMVEIWNPVELPKALIVKEVAGVEFNNELKQYYLNETDSEILQFRKKELERWSRVEKNCMRV